MSRAAMSVVSFELNDAGIVAVRESAPDVLAFPESPGYALVDGNEILTGGRARARARLKPRFTHTHFWEHLDTAPLSRPFPAKLSRADLAHAHLESLWRQAGASRAVLSVPGWYSLEQLGLILGMAKACGMPVTGMMDSALAAAAGVTEGRALIHLDLHLHRVTASRILRDDQLVREDTAVDDRAGSIPLHDAWVTLIAQSFVRQTRFDPLHAAATEQKIYESLPGWLEALYDEEVSTLALNVSGRRYTVELAREDVIRAAEPYYEPIAALAVATMPGDGPAMLLVSHRLAALPGIVEKLSRDVSDNILVLPATAAASGALLYERHSPAEAEEDGALTFLTSLPLGQESRSSDEAPLAGRRGDEGRAPTHVLFRGRAHALAPEPFLIGVSIPGDQRGLELTGETAGVSRYHCSIYRVDGRVVVEDHSKFGSFLNGKRVQERAVLAAGDRLRLGTPGVELELIEVVE